ncbi:MAG: ATP-binding protein [Pseudobdellovibrionaceae bacterium]|nr:MAG: ATP-binding protein [Pseudobdellovibrionaceae bacterium]
MNKPNRKPIPRYLDTIITNLALDHGKMAFISGPRQVGKTTMVQLIGQSFEQSVYKNWDQTEFKRVWAKSPDQIAEEFDLSKIKESRLLILDEIHKSKSWKQKLKGLYDTRGDSFSIIVTGSARLNIYKKGADSLMGRYFNFRLHPFSLREALGLAPNSPELVNETLFSGRPVKSPKGSVAILNELMDYGGFPEPFLRKNKAAARLWRRGRNEKIVREDLRDLSRVQEISQIETLISLLPEKVGSPLSVQSLREDLDVAHDTVSRWLGYLKELYFFFEVKPFSRSIPRSLKKEGKIYFYDWCENTELGAKFENLVASHLLKACHFWDDSGLGQFGLHYLRNKEKKEVDFLISKDSKPWFTVECKNGDTALDTNYQKFSKYTKCPHLQVVFEPDVFRKVDEQTAIVGADRFLAALV